MKRTILFLLVLMSLPFLGMLTPWYQDPNHVYGIPPTEPMDDEDYEFYYERSRERAEKENAPVNQVKAIRELVLEIHRIRKDMDIIVELLQEHRDSLKGKKEFNSPEHDEIRKKQPGWNPQHDPKGDPLYNFRADEVDWLYEDDFIGGSS